MTDDTHRFQCPCCHNPLEFDTSSGQVHAVDGTAASAIGASAPGSAATGSGRSAPERRPERPSTPPLEELVKKAQKDQDRVGDAFTAAARDALTQADRFDAMFDSALEAAKKDKDKKPRSPFDMD